PLKGGVVPRRRQVDVAGQTGVSLAELVRDDGAETRAVDADAAPQPMAGQRAFQVDDVVAGRRWSANRANDGEVVGHAGQARQVLAEADAGDAGGDSAERSARRRAGLRIEGL